MRVFTWDQGVWQSIEDQFQTYPPLLSHLSVSVSFVVVVFVLPGAVNAPQPGQNRIGLALFRTTLKNHFAAGPNSRSKSSSQTPQMEPVATVITLIMFSLLHSLSPKSFLQRIQESYSAEQKSISFIYNHTYSHILFSNLFHILRICCKITMYCMSLCSTYPLVMWTTCYTRVKYTQWKDNV